MLVRLAEETAQNTTNSTRDLTVSSNHQSETNEAQFKITVGNSER